MQETFEVTRIEKGTGEQTVLTLHQALHKLSNYHKDLNLVREALAEGQVAQTPYAYYKRRKGA